MDKKILDHKKFVQAEIRRLKTSKDKTATRDLLAYHEMRVRDFQHERAIHLAVTFFFAGLTFLVWVAFVGWFLFSATISETGDSANIVTLALFLLGIILTVLEIFYVRHYYRLENRTQKLYELTDEIYKLI
jgi:uncharacterized membrane protein (DUF485 family)